MTRWMRLFLITACLVLSACSVEKEDQIEAARQAAIIHTDGVLPAQTDELLAQEWQIYRAKHADLDEATAKKHFDAIQRLSAAARENMPQQAATTAAWAERRALAKAWLKNRIEDVYAPNTVSDEMIQAGLDAYAFDSGHPALVTASHILIKDDGKTTDEERKKVIDDVYARLAKLSNPTNDDLNGEGVRLLRAGYDVDVNLDLEFPRFPMQSFLGEQLPYHAVVEPFAAAAFALNAQHPLSPVTKSEFGYHIILFQSMTPEKKPALADVREYMLSRIIDQGRRVAMSQFLAGLEQNSDMRINEAKLNELMQQN